MNVGNFGKIAVLTLALGACGADKKPGKELPKNCPDKEALIQEIKKDLLSNGIALKGEEEAVDEHLGNLIEQASGGNKVNFKSLKCFEIRGKVFKLICMTSSPKKDMSFRGSFVLEKDKKGAPKKARGIKVEDMKELIRKTGGGALATCKNISLKKAIKNQPPFRPDSGATQAMDCKGTVFYLNKTKDIVDMGIAEEE